MLKKISISLFLVVYLSVSTVSFAEEVVLEVISEIPVVVEEVVSEPVVENIPEEIIPEIPPVEQVVPPVVPGNVNTPEVYDASTPQEIIVDEMEVADTPQETQENIIETLPEEIQDPSVLIPTDSGDVLNAAPEEGENPETAEVPVVVEVEENSIFTPPGPEPEPWQPTVREDPTTESNTLVGDTETQSDPAFLAENSVFTRRLAESVVVDPTAKHTCKVDIFRTDISDVATSTLSVKFYGTSTLAAYDAEIGSLPNGIDVRFEKNNDYLYDFRGKETTLTLSVEKQDGSLSGDFTIPIIFTHKGKQESSVICQLNLINDEEIVVAPIIVPVPETVELVLDPSEVFVQEILDMIIPQPEPVIETPTIIENVISDVPPPVIPPLEIPPVALPEIEEGAPELTLDTVLPPEPVVITEPLPEVVPEPVSEIVTPVIESVPVVESAPIPLSDVSST